MEEVIIEAGLVKYGVKIDIKVLVELYKDSISSLDFLVLLDDHCEEHGIEMEASTLENYANWVYEQVGMYYSSKG